MPQPDPVTIRATTPADAVAWCSFVAREQARTCADVMPDWFGTSRLEMVEQNSARVSAYLLDGTYRAVQAEAAGRIVGVAAAGPAPAEWEAEHGFVPAPADQQLDRLYLQPDHQGTGLADRLMDAVVLPGPVYPWLIDGNTRAERFYMRRGFTSLDEQQIAGESWGEVAMHRMVRG